MWRAVGCAPGRGRCGVQRMHIAHGPMLDAPHLWGSPILLSAEQGLGPDTEYPPPGDSLHFQ